jgi:N-glycosylase/DNA lyase
MRLDGVGEKIADCVLAFSLDKPEAFPIDRWTRRALEEWYGLPPKLNNSRAADWARERFGQSGAIAQQYMFHRERLLGRARAWGGRHLGRALPEDAAGLAARATAPS